MFQPYSQTTIEIVGGKGLGPQKLKKRLNQLLSVHRVEIPPTVRAQPDTFPPLIGALTPHLATESPPPANRKSLPDLFVPQKLGISFGQGGNDGANRDSRTTSSKKAYAPPDTCEHADCLSCI